MTAPARDFGAVVATLLRDFPELPPAVSANLARILDGLALLPPELRGTTHWAVAHHLLASAVPRVSLQPPEDAAWKEALYRVWLGQADDRKGAEEVLVS